MELPDGTLSYEFLNSTNISDSHEKGICSTITELLSYKAMKEQSCSFLGS